jgi:hypothetical protein
LQKKIIAKSSQKGICATKKNPKHRFESKNRKFLKTQPKDFCKKENPLFKKNKHRLQKKSSLPRKEEKKTLPQPPLFIYNVALQGLRCILQSFFQEFI